MGVREILRLGNPRLREPAHTVLAERFGTPELRQLITDMVDTMHHANGAGLAATQIGEPHRVVVIEVASNPRYPYKPDIPLTVMVNPEIVDVDPETILINEGCLSVPNLRGDVPRHVAATVRYLDPDGHQREERVVGLSAGTFQHEIDHLDGILFVDRVVDSRTLSFWDEFERYHREDFLRRIGAVSRTAER